MATAKIKKVRHELRRNEDGEVRLVRVVEFVREIVGD